MSLNFVTASTSLKSDNKSQKFPQLKKDEKTVITFLGQIKDFEPKSANGNDVAFFDTEYYFDETTKSYFKFASNVSDKIKNKITSKPSVKKSVKRLAAVLQYTTESKNGFKVTGINDLFILPMGKDKSDFFTNLNVGNKEEFGEDWSLFDCDFKVTCGNSTEDEKYQKWSLLPTAKKAFNSLKEEEQAEWIKKAKNMISTQFKTMFGKELEEEELIEKFALDMDQYVTSASKTNLMSGEDEEEFGHLKTSNKAFGSK